MAAILICGLLILSSFPVLLVLPETLHLNDSSRDSASVKKSIRSYGFSAYRSFLKDWWILVMMAIVFLTQFRYLVDSVRLPYTSVRILMNPGGNTRFNCARC